MPPKVVTAVERLLREQVSKTGLPLPLVEKDYALSYVLAGIADVPPLYEIALFKGGSLRKAYFQGYRFSQDLDYTIVGAIECAQLLTLVEQAVARASALLNERGPFDLTVKHLPGSDPHQRGQCEFKIAVRFPWMRDANCVVKLEMLPAPPEIIAGTPRELAVIHDFSETLTTRARCYQLEEVAAEKLRSFLQTRARSDAKERTWVRTRPRDLFDISRLHRQTQYALDHRVIRPFLEQKCPPYGVTFTRAGDFLDPRVLGDMQRDWDASLGPFIQPLPTFEECLDDHKALVGRVFA